MRVATRYCLTSFLVVLIGATTVFAQHADEHLVMGKPSPAETTAAKANDYLLVNKYFALSYDNAKGTPNWVSWHLEKSHLGQAPRKRRFDHDDRLPANFNIITHDDYNGSGFDRGHMCPHGDRTLDQASSFGTFVMTNIIPQSAEVNQHAWNHLEDYCRHLVVNDNKELYIVSGPAGIRGEGLHGVKSKIAGGKVTVPSDCWKVILILDHKDGNDVSRVDHDVRTIAVIMPNDRSVGERWDIYRHSVKDIEDLTGYTFFSNVHGDWVKAWKEHVDDEIIPVPHPINHHGQ